VNLSWGGAEQGWQSRTTFVLALCASAVGLGNIWRFSYLTGEYGGGLFVISYILCLLLVAVPIMIAEVALGFSGQANPFMAYGRAANRSLRSRSWAFLGSLAALTGLLILSYYSVVAGWALAYAADMQRGAFAAASAVVVAEYFDDLLANPLTQTYWHSVFMLVALAFSALGVRRGLGILAWLVVPSLIVLLAVLVGFAMDTGDTLATRDYLFTADWDSFSVRSLLVALGHAFFTLSVGVGVGVSYGAFAARRVPIARSVLSVAIFDTVIALFAGLAIFPIVFANNMQPAMGPGLMFVSLPYAFGNLFQGELFGTAFFGLTALAALGSAVALLEPPVQLVMERLQVRRVVAVALVGMLVWALGLWVILSFNIWSDWQWLGQNNFQQFLELLTADILLPLVSLGTAVLVGWRMRPELLRLLLKRESRLFFAVWRFLLRYVLPVAIALILLASPL
jgi:neurotransmitter:Na+ symporter, NSS family